MPTVNDRVRSIVYLAIDELNEQLPAEARLARDESTPLAGPAGHLDSLGLVNLIALLEERVEREFNHSLNLIDDGLVEGGPFESVGALVSYLSSLLGERAHA